MYFPTISLSTVIIFSILTIKSTALDMQFYSAGNCEGFAGACIDLPPETCCTSTQGYVSIKLVGEAPNFYLSTCAYPECEQYCVAPTPINECHSPTWAIFSGVIQIDGARSRDPILGYQRHRGRYSRPAEITPSNPLLVSEIDHFKPKPTANTKCVTINAIVYADDDGQEMVAKFPEGRAEEFIQALRKGDMGKLKELNGERRKSATFDVAAVKKTEMKAN